MRRHVVAQLWYRSDAPHGVTISNHNHICPSSSFWRSRYSAHCDMQQNNSLTPAPLSRWSEVTRRRRSCASPSSPPTNQASPTSSSGKIINLHAALLHDPACRTKTRERRGKAAQPTQKINPVRYGLSSSGDFSEQKVRMSVSESAAELRAILR